MLTAIGGMNIIFRFIVFAIHFQIFNFAHFWWAAPQKLRITNISYT